MKKIFKALAITAASAAMCVGVAVTAGCSTGTNGTYTGAYSYTNSYGATYGMRVEVTVENNIITNIKDITNSAESLKTQSGYVRNWEKDGIYEFKDSDVKWETVSPGWEHYYNSASNSWLWTETDENGNKIPSNPVPEPNQTFIGRYNWTNDTEENWTSHTSWLLQQYVGWSVADILAINVYTDYGYSYDSKAKSFYADNTISGEPYEANFNTEMKNSNLLISGSTQGSGRLLKAVQDALKNN